MVPEALSSRLTEAGIPRGHRPQSVSSCHWWTATPNGEVVFDSVLLHDRVIHRRHGVPREFPGPSTRILRKAILPPARAGAPAASPREARARPSKAADGGTRFRDVARHRPGGRLARAGARSIGGTARSRGRIHFPVSQEAATPAPPQGSDGNRRNEHHAGRHLSGARSPAASGTRRSATPAPSAVRRLILSCAKLLGGMSRQPCLVAPPLSPRGKQHVAG